MACFVDLRTDRDKTIFACDPDSGSCVRLLPQQITPYDRVLDVVYLNPTGPLVPFLPPLTGGFFQANTRPPPFVFLAIGTNQYI